MLGITVEVARLRSNKVKRLLGNKDVFYAGGVVVVVVAGGGFEGGLSAAVLVVATLWMLLTMEFAPQPAKPDIIMMLGMVAVLSTFVKTEEKSVMAIPREMARE